MTDAQLLADLINVIRGQDKARANTARALERIVSDDSLSATEVLEEVQMIADRLNAEVGR